ncbi:MAG: hypothetical protein JSS87_08390 [Acidobacteria bacterium]|nr:hypothetical protein [Acidobacteriota bacterium]
MSQSPNPLVLQAFTYDDRSVALPAVRSAVTSSGGWILGKKSVSGSALELQIEVQHRSMLNLYAALVGSGIELTRAAHLALCESCTCTQQMPQRRKEIATVQLALAFISELNLASLMQSPTAMA